MTKLSLQQVNKSLPQYMPKYGLNVYKWELYQQLQDFDDIRLAKILSFIPLDLKSNLNQPKINSVSKTIQYWPYKNSLKTDQQDLKNLIHWLEYLDYNQVLQDLEWKKLSKSSIFLLNHKDEILNYLNENHFKLNHFSNAQYILLEKLLNKLEQIAKN